VTLPYFGLPDRDFRALDPGNQKARSEDSGYSNWFLKTLGRDCSGLVNPASVRTRNIESDIEHSRVSHEYQSAGATSGRIIYSRLSGYTSILPKMKRLVRIIVE
jgi:hypothetical protein